MSSRWLPPFSALFSVALLSIATLADLHGQDKSSSASSNQNNTFVKLSIESNLVQIPVVVTNKRGEHVSGLAQADFEVREDGREQKITSFEEVKAETSAIQRQVLASDKFSNQLNVGRPKSLEIILLDLLNTPLSARAEARRGLVSFLSKSADANILLALLVLRSDGVNMVHNFTTDPAVLVEAIRRLQVPVSSRDNPALYTLGGDTDAELQQLRRISTGQAIASRFGSLALPGMGIALLREDEALSDLSRQNQEALMTLECLQQIARYFAAVPGRKSLFWASTGFQFSIGSMQREPQGPTLDVWQQTMRLLQDANIAIYPVDLGGVNLAGQGDAKIHGEIPPNGGRDALEAGRLGDPTMAKHLTMNTVATMTGGRAFYNLNDSDALFRRARQDSEQYYMLAYYTKHKENAGWRKLSVRVYRDGVSIRARSGFFFRNAARDPEAARRSDEIMALTSALDSTSIPISGQWQEVETTNGDQRKAHFVVSLPPGSIFIDSQQENHINLDFRVLAFDAEGKQAAAIGQRLERKLTTQDLAEVQADGISYKNTITVPPGKYDVHIVVRDNLKGTLGSVTTEIKVE